MKKDDRLAWFILMCVALAAVFSLAFMLLPNGFSWFHFDAGKAVSFSIDKCPYYSSTLTTYQTLLTSYNNLCKKGQAAQCARATQAQTVIKEFTPLVNECKHPTPQPPKQNVPAPVTPQPLPNLIVTDVTYNAGIPLQPPQAGLNELVFSFNIKNVGNLATPRSFSVTIFQPSGAGEVTHNGMANLQPGQTQAMNSGIIYDMTKGISGTVTICADDDVPAAGKNLIQESNENDNCANVQFSVAPVQPACAANQNQACGCGGTIQCDGTCNKAACPQGQTCTNGQCSVRCNPRQGLACNCGGSMLCDGSCSSAPCSSVQSCQNSQCVSGTPDLTFTSISFSPQNPVPGNIVTVTAMMQNIGTAAIYFPGVSWNGGGGTYIDNPAIPTTFAPGTSAPLSVRWQYPNQGMYNVQFQIVGSASTPESSYTNNAIGTTITVSPGAPAQQPNPTPAPAPQPPQQQTCSSNPSMCSSSQRCVNNQCVDRCTGNVNFRTSMSPLRQYLGSTNCQPIFAPGFPNAQYWNCNSPFSFNFGWYPGMADSNSYPQGQLCPNSGQQPEVSSVNCHNSGGNSFPASASSSGGWIYTTCNFPSIPGKAGGQGSDTNSGWDTIWSDGYVNCCFP